MWINWIKALNLALLISVAPAGERVVLSPTRYDLRFDVDYAAETLRATARIELLNPSSRPVADASFLLYRLLPVRAVRDGDGKPLAFIQAVVAFDDFEQLQVNHLLATLAKPLAPGAKTTVEIDYEGHLLGYVETGMLYVKDRIDPEFTILRQDAFAYPEPGFPSVALRRGTVTTWSFDYSAAVTVPKDYVVANGGRLDGKDAAADRVTFHYSSLKPSWRMDFAIAKYGELSAGPLRIFYLPGDSAGAAAVAEAAGKALEIFRRWFGPPPRESPLTFIEIADGWGSQTDVTTIIQAAAAFREAKQHREVFHELSHLWNPPDTDVPPSRWNEGLATFLEYRMAEELTGQRLLEERAGRSLATLRKRVTEKPELRKVPLSGYGRANLTDFSYSVGGVFFDLLYRLAGADTFNRIIRDYVAQHGQKGGGIADLVRVAKRDAPAGLSPLYEDWLLTTGWVARIEQGATIEDLEAYYRGRLGKESPEKRTPRPAR